MSPEVFALLQRIHGHLALLGLAVLLHPVLTLGRKGMTRGMRWSLVAAGVLVAGPFAMGWWLYPTYREAIKPSLVREHTTLALAFESKEHLALMCLSLTLSGVSIALLGGREPRARRLARVLLALAWLTGVTTAVLGLWVAGGAHPAW